MIIKWIVSKESELVAGLCEMWLFFSLWSINTLSWVLGLIQNNNNNLMIMIDILSELFWKLIKYVNNIINPYNGDLCYENYRKLYNNIYLLYILFLYNNVYLLYNLFYTWTSKIKDPSERNTPCIDLLKIHYQLVVYFFYLYLWIKIKIIYIFNQGVPYLNIILAQKFLIFIHFGHHLKFKLNKIMNKVKLQILKKLKLKILKMFKFKNLMSILSYLYNNDYKKNKNKESLLNLSFI